MGAQRRHPHRHARLDAYQADVALFVIAHQPARHVLRAAGSTQIDADLSLAVRITKDVAAGQHQGFAFASIDQRARSVGEALGIGNLQPYAGADQLVGSDGLAASAGFDPARRKRSSGIAARTTQEPAPAATGKGQPRQRTFGARADCRRAGAVGADSRAGEHRFQLSAADGAGQAADFPAIDQQHEAGNVLHVILAGQVPLSIDVDAADRIAGLLELGDRRGHRSTGSAPAGMKIQERRIAGSG